MCEDECAVVSNEDNDTNENISRDIGGRPVGTTIVSKHKNYLHRVKFRNDISINYTVEKRSLPYGKRLRLYILMMSIVVLCSSDV